ncbi:MAG: PAS domain-containing sensor histidine kinase, partial [bacterium]
EKGGLIPWDPNVKNFHLVDLDKDGRKELITVVFTGLARLPRGVLVHTYPEGKLIGKKIIGAALDGSYLGDYDHDGYFELVVQTVAPRNFTYYGGFDDEHSYILVFKLDPVPRIIWWKKMGELWSQPILFYADFNGDGHLEFLSFTWTHSYRPERACLQLMEPGTWRIYFQHTVEEPLVNPFILDVNHDMVPEILAVCSPGEIWLFDYEFTTIQRRRVAQYIKYMTILPDMDDDGVEEIVVSVPEGNLFLGPDLKVKAFLPVDEGQISGIMQRGIGNSPYLICTNKKNNVFFRLVKNRYYLLHRYRDPLLWILGISAILALVFAVNSLRGRHRLLQSVQSLALDTEARGLLLLNPQGQVLLVNQRLRDWFQLPEAHRMRHRPIGKIFDEPELLEFVSELKDPPPRRRETTLFLCLQSHEHMFKIIAEPIPHIRKTLPFWLLIFEDLTSLNALQQVKTWNKMAQRVAHDIKNPLTSILLTLQRLQMEYRDRAPEMSKAFDGFTTRIMERIEFLRRMTRNFMKFVNVEKLNLVETDLNALIEEGCEEIKRGLPPDISLVLKLNPELPVVRLDPEQMQAVIENLVSNAVNAMPEGGKITMVSNFQKNLHLQPNGEGPHDYVVLEVQDTGVGIPESERARLFEPDFTSINEGTGLGLALVKKIIDDHGGYIEVDSEVGVGTAFCVYLPVKS